MLFSVLIYLMRLVLCSERNVPAEVANMTGHTCVFNSAQGVKSPHVHVSGGVLVSAFQPPPQFLSHPLTHPLPLPQAKDQPKAQAQPKMSC